MSARLLAILGLGVVWTGSAVAEPRPHHDIAWYQAHPAERYARMRVCQSDMAYQSNADCLNANEADVRLNVQRANDDLHRRGLFLPWETPRR